jgi:hypothetical protein
VTSQLELIYGDLGLSETSSVSGLSMIDKLEIRTETDEFELNRQRYALRISPIGLGVRKQQKKLLNLLNEERGFEFQKFIFDARKDLVEEYIAFTINDSKLESLTQLMALKEDKFKILDLLIESNDKFLNDILESENEKILDSIEYQILFLNRVDNNAIERTLISVEELSKKLNLLRFAEKNYSKYEYETNILNVENKLKSAENNKILDFVQIDYRGPHDNILDKKLSLGLGLQIPYSNGNDLSNQKKIIEKQLLDDKLVFEKELFEKELKSEIDKLQLLINKYDLVNEGILKSDLRFKSLLATAEHVAVQNPLIEINHKIKIQKQKYQQISVYKEILSNYNDIIDKLDIESLDSYFAWWNKGK